MPSQVTIDSEGSTETEPQVRTLIQQERLLALGQMASGFAHDINNSLTPIIGYSDFLLDPRSDLSDQSKKCLQCIRTAAGDIAEMIEHVRQFYRRRGDEEQPKPLDLNGLVKQALEGTRSQWRDLPQKSGIILQVETHLDKALPQILGVENELREAVTHLIVNAVEAMPEGGTLKLTTRTQPILDPSRKSATGDDVTLEVTDTGMGMDEYTQQRCIEPFFSTKGPRGCGLSLAMVYGTMRRHGGLLQIESDLGHGTTMRLVFQAAESRLAPPDAESKVTTLRILCIDDDHRISAMLKEVLSSEHHQVEVANGGQKGLRAFRKAQTSGKPFHVVITDLGMPNVDGRQIVRAVKKEAPETPVILLTAWAAVNDQAGELPPGVDAVVQKPPSIDRLQEVLAQVTVSKFSGA